MTVELQNLVREGEQLFANPKRQVAFNVESWFRHATTEDVKAFSLTVANATLWYGKSTASSGAAMITVCQAFRVFNPYVPESLTRRRFRGTPFIQSLAKKNALVVRGRLKTGKRRLQSWTTNLPTAMSFSGQGWVLLCVDPSVLEYGNTNWIVSSARILARRVGKAYTAERLGSKKRNELLGCYNVLRNFMSRAKRYKYESEVFLYFPAGTGQAIAAKYEVAMKTFA